MFSSLFCTVSGDNSSCTSYPVFKKFMVFSTISVCLAVCTGALSTMTISLSFAPTVQLTSGEHPVKATQPESFATQGMKHGHFECFPTVTDDSVDTSAQPRQRIVAFVSFLFASISPQV